MFSHQNYEPLEIKCNFQRPSSSELVESSSFTIKNAIAGEILILFHFLKLKDGLHEINKNSN